jgi:hypothetical protein
VPLTGKLWLSWAYRLLFYRKRFEESSGNSGILSAEHKSSWQIRGRAVEIIEILE